MTHPIVNGACYLVKVCQMPKDSPTYKAVDRALRANDPEAAVKACEDNLPTFRALDYMVVELRRRFEQLKAEQEVIA